MARISIGKTSLTVKYAALAPAEAKKKIDDHASRWVDRLIMLLGFLAVIIGIAGVIVLLKGQKKSPNEPIPGQDPTNRSSHS